MSKKLDNTKEEIKQILNKRSEEFFQKNQEKIALVKEHELEEIFSNQENLVNEKISFLKDLLKERTLIDQNIDSLNDELSEIIAYLKETKASNLEKMQDILSASGKKRSFFDGTNHLNIRERDYNKYVTLHNEVKEIDEVIGFIERSLNTEPTTNYEIDEKNIGELAPNDLANYYASLSALILCEEITEPTLVTTSKSHIVNKKQANNFTKCYEGYCQAKKIIQKRNRISNLKLKFKMLVSNIESSVVQLLNGKSDKKNNLKLKKSAAVAYLVASLIAGIISPANTNTNKRVLKSSDIAISREALLDIITDNIAEEEFAKKGNQKTIYISKRSSTPDTDMLASSTIKTVTTATSIQPEVPLEVIVPENAYEISKVDVPKQNVTDEETEKEVVDDTNKQIILADNNKIETTENTNPETEEVQADLISVGRNNNEIVRGLHLTYNNTTYELSDYEYEALYQTVLRESSGDYQDALAVVSLVFNRKEDPRFPDNVIDILSSPGQFAVWQSVKRDLYYGNNNPVQENIVNAIYDVTERGIRNNDFVEFKAAWRPDYSNGEIRTQLVTGGNKFHNLAVELDRTNDSDNSFESDKNKELKKVF